MGRDISLNNYWWARCWFLGSLARILFWPLGMSCCLIILRTGIGWIKLPKCFFFLFFCWFFGRDSTSDWSDNESYLLDTDTFWFLGICLIILLNEVVFFGFSKPGGMVSISSVSWEFGIVVMAFKSLGRFVSYSVFQPWFYYFYLWFSHIDR